MYLISVSVLETLVEVQRVLTSREEKEVKEKAKNKKEITFFHMGTPTEKKEKKFCGNPLETDKLYPQQ